ncbi:hypothetical protein HPULCUR_001166 [Helicostylum pulchrum]|uniref:Uncharacterized protein n=1 Tax=Helicostylum pulchrum TaxID=562976 RepID=A0ABP9XLY4_9FUNG
MAFVQQQRRCRQRQASSEDLGSAAKQVVVAPIISDSDTDWHVISSNTSSPILFPSESESSSFRPSDTERDTESDSQQAFLPSHDGTGTFIVEDVEFFSSDQTSEVSSIECAIQNLNSDNSVLDLLLVQTPPSFAENKVLPHFVPTAAGINSQELASVSADDDDDEQQQQRPVKFTSKRQKNLDSIPVHHPGIIPGSSTSAAIISIVWANLKRLTNHLIENDTNTVETLSTLMSEAVMEGCMPFSSHLHMDLESYQPRLGGAV